MTIKFNSRDFDVSTFKFNRWSLTLDETQTLDDALDPVAWTNLVEKIRGFNKAGGRGDIIEVRKLDTGLYAELLVQEIETGSLKVSLLRQLEPVGVTISADAPYTTRWNVGGRSHEVIRTADRQVIKGGFQSRPSAVEWIQDQMNKTAKVA